MNMTTLRGHPAGAKPGDDDRRQTGDQRPVVNVEAASAPGPALGNASAIEKPVTLRTIARWVQQKEKFACLTAYDATTARWLQRAGVPVLLVGDTAAEMI